MLTRGPGRAGRRARGVRDRHAAAARRVRRPPARRRPCGRRAGARREDRADVRRAGRAPLSAARGLAPRARVAPGAPLASLLIVFKE